MALLIVVLAAGLTIAGLAKGMRPACQVTTVTNTAGSPGGTTTTKVCGMLDVTDYIYVLAIVGVLLLPDMKSLKIGGLEFERLTTEVAKQTSEIGQLRVEVSNVASNTNSIRIQVGEVARLAFADWRTHFRKQIDVLEKNRRLLPEDTQTASDLEKVDGVEKRIDAEDLDPVELWEAVQIAHRLVACVLAAKGTSGDNLADARNAGDVLHDLLGGGPGGS